MAPQVPLSNQVCDVLLAVRGSGALLGVRATQVWQFSFRLL